MAGFCCFTPVEKGISRKCRRNKVSIASQQQFSRGLLLRAAYQQRSKSPRNNDEKKETKNFQKILVHKIFW